MFASSIPVHLKLFSMKICPLEQKTQRPWGKVTNDGPTPEFEYHLGALVARMQVRRVDHWHDKANWTWGVLYRCREDPRPIVPRPLDHRGHVMGPLGIDAAVVDPA